MTDSRRSILITRPLEQSASLCEQLTALGHRVTCLPTLEIKPTEPSADALKLIKSSPYDGVIFISANAVMYGLQLVIQDPDRWYAIGPSTQQQLLNALITANRKTKPVLTIATGMTANSENLLLRPELQSISRQRFLIVKGEGGLNVLSDTLRQRGAHVDELIVYQRVAISQSLETLQQIWASQHIDTIITTSLSGLQNFMHWFDASSYHLLHHCQLIVISERMAESAQSYQSYFKTIYIAGGADDNAILNALLRCKQAH